MRLGRICQIFILSLLPIISYAYYYQENPHAYHHSKHGYRSSYHTYYNNNRSNNYYYRSNQSYVNRYGARRSTYSYHPNPTLASKIAAPGEKVIIVNPRVHAFGAYDAQGNLLRSGIATAGAGYCRDIHRGCRTKVGSFRIFSLGNKACKSHKFPLPRGGAPMPYCMFFSGGQGLHGSYNVVYGNVSHGCVRLNVADAAWIRFNFARVGTKVVVKPY